MLGGFRRGVTEADFSYSLSGQLRLAQLPVNPIIEADIAVGVAVSTLHRNDIHKVDVLCPTQNLMRKFEFQVENIFYQVDKLREYNEKHA